jgi:hypothetical protein
VGEVKRRKGKSMTKSTRLIEGDLIAPPAWRNWAMIVFGLVAAGLGFNLRELGRAFVDIPNFADSDIALYLGLALILVGMPVLLHGGTMLWRRPRYVIGADRLQSVEGRETVKFEIQYENLAAIEICKQNRVAAPFLGFRFHDADLYPAEMLGQKQVARDQLKKLGYDWHIPEAMSTEALLVVLDKIRERWRPYRSGLQDDPEEA